MLRLATRISLALTCSVTLLAASLISQVPTPESVIGWKPGADYKLADYDQISGYFRQLDAATDRMQLFEIGTTAEGRTMLLAAISSAQNLTQLDRWKDISRRMAQAEGLSETEARALAKEGKAIVWIDGGLHGTEVAGAQHTPLLAHHLVTSEDDEVRQIRDNTVVLLMPVMNPDGLDIVANWYRSNVGSEFETAPLPVLYNKYVGHDNNRDWFMIQQPETRAIAYQLWFEWFPQIVYNHHQTGPFPGRIFVPPFSDPVNPNIPPLVVRGINLVGAAMAKRFDEEGKPGVSSYVQYSMWWNGGMRTAPYFHNQIGILTETHLYSLATPHYYEPDSLPQNLGPRRGATVSAKQPSIFYPNPWQGGWWRLGDAVDYMFTGSMAVADIGAELKEDWLFNMYRMASQARTRGTEEKPFAYVIPYDQWDATAAAELVGVLRRGGVELHRSTASFTAGGSSYAPGSYIAFTAQPFRAHLVDLMEPQNYPDRRVYPGGPPDRPYDLAGWTLPLQMGVRVDRVDEPFEAAAARVEELTVAAGAGEVSGDGPVYLLSPNHNASARAVLRLLARGTRVSQATEGFTAAGTAWPAGTFLARASAGRLRELATEFGLQFVGADNPSVTAFELESPRVGLYKSWVANMDEGWTRWILEDYGVEFETLADADIRTGQLDRFDAIVLPDQEAEEILGGHVVGTMPPEYTGGVGAEGTANLKRFVEQGGTLITFDHASDFAIDQFGLPVRNAVRGVPEQEFFVPGSLIRIEVDAEDPIAYGMQPEAAASFQNSQAFSVIAPAAAGDRSAPREVDVVVRYAEHDLLMSGWELGAERHIGGRPAVVRVPLGQGSVVLIGFRPQFRGQPRGTFKLIFNAILSAAAQQQLPTTEEEEGEGR
jgi:hypothetical protein